MSHLTLYFDSLCPLCAKEMKSLQKNDKNDRISVVDIHHPAFTQNYPHIDPQAASDILHGELETGELILGLDATHYAWSSVGQGYKTAFLRWPVVAFFADIAYRIFAKHRYKISYLLTGKARCETTTCSIDTPRQQIPKQQENKGSL